MRVTKFVNPSLTGEDIAINDLALFIKAVVGYIGNIIFDISKPDWTPRKLMDVSKLHNKSWKHSVELEEGFRFVYHDFR